MRLLLGNGRRRRLQMIGSGSVRRVWGELPGLLQCWRRLLQAYGFRCVFFAVELPQGHEWNYLCPVEVLGLGYSPIGPASSREQWQPVTPTCLGGSCKHTFNDVLPRCLHRDVCPPRSEPEAQSNHRQCNRDLRPRVIFFKI